MAYLSNNFMSTLYKQYIHNKTDETLSSGQISKQTPEESLDIPNASGSFYLLTSANTTVIVIFSCVLLTGVVGNLGLIFAASRMKHKIRILTNQFKLLCGINVITSFFIPTLLIYQVINDYQRWEFGNFGCTILPSLNQFSITASQGICIMMLLEQYILMTRPFYQSPANLPSKNILSWCFVIIFLAVLMEIPYASTLKIIQNEEINTCLSVGAHGVQLAASSIHFVRDAIMLAVTVYLLLKCQKVISKNLHMNSTKTNCRRNIAGVIALTQLFLVIPSDFFHVFVQSVNLTHKGNTKWQNKSNRLNDVNTVFEIIQMLRLVSNVFIFLFVLMKNCGTTESTTNVVISTEQCEHLREATSFPGFSDGKRRLKNKLLVKIIDEEDPYYLTETSSCASSNF
ncbi:histamine H2 receptor-like [Clytia hemisphaerica]|uniref:histamine H2 receptor-like n=1 Tax=Clytia hemisphaerica TaxID=252671 RepID=UPI0034D44145|eukprot:TCONS_00065361-protein